MYERIKKAASAALTAVAASTVLAAAPAGALSVGVEGCTPGYWKTHTENWLETPTQAISTETLVTSAFARAPGRGRTSRTSPSCRPCRAAAGPGSTVPR